MEVSGWQLAVDSCMQNSYSQDGDNVIVLQLEWVALKLPPVRVLLASPSLSSRDRLTFEQNANRGNGPEASVPLREEKHDGEAQRRDDAAVADSVRARLSKHKNLVILDVDTENGKVVS